MNSMEEKQVKNINDKEMKAVIEKFTIEKDGLLEENQRLAQEIAHLIKMIEIDNGYIDYLMNSKWWKMTAPLRRIDKKIRVNGKQDDYDFMVEKKAIKDMKLISKKISVIIFTYNAGEEFTVQLENIKKQKLVEDVEIIIIDKGSIDKTVDYAKKFGAITIMAKNDDLTQDEELYVQYLSKINGEYVVIINQNRIIDNEYWLFQAVRPIHDEKALQTIIVDDKNINEIKRTECYKNLKGRIGRIGKVRFLFLPVDRNVIQYVPIIFRDKAFALARRRAISRFFV